MIMTIGAEAARKQSYRSCHCKVLLERKVLVANFKIERSPQRLKSFGHKKVRK